MGGERRFDSFYVRKEILERWSPKIESTDGVLRWSQLGSGVFVDSHVRVTTRDSCKCPVALNKLGPLMGSLDYTRRGK